MFKYNVRPLAVTLGVLLGINATAGALVIVVYVVSLSLFDRLSLAAITAGISAPVMLRMLGAPPGYIWLGLIGCAYVILSHSGSIMRLLDGTESRFRKRD